MRSVTMSYNQWKLENTYQDGKSRLLKDLIELLAEQVIGGANAMSLEDR